MPKPIIITVLDNGTLSLDAGGNTVEEVEGLLLRVLALTQRAMTVSALKAALTSGVVLGGGFRGGPRG
jgi:hypothetical protein